MKQLALFLLFTVIIMQAPAQAEYYSEQRGRVEAINKMPLYVSYLVPVDSVGRYINDEFLSLDICDHCVLLANKTDKYIREFATIYFDGAGNVRKTIKRWTDGGELNNVVYYDENGDVIYAVYSKGGEEHGRLYSFDSRVNIEHYSSYSNYSRGFYIGINMTTNDLASVYKVKLEPPSNCRTVCFSQIRKGDFGFLLTSSIYKKPNGEVEVFDEQAMLQPYFGLVVQIISINGGWCQVLHPGFDKPLGYVRECDLELFFQ